MMAMLHRFRGSLPRHRVELYAEFVMCFSGRRHMARGLEVDFNTGTKGSCVGQTCVPNDVSLCEGDREVGRH